MMNYSKLDESAVIEVEQDVNAIESQCNLFDSEVICGDKQTQEFFVEETITPFTSTGDNTTRENKSKSCLREELATETSESLFGLRYCEAAAQTSQSLWEIPETLFQETAKQYQEKYTEMSIGKEKLFSDQIVPNEYEKCKPIDKRRVSVKRLGLSKRDKIKPLHGKNI